MKGGHHGKLSPPPKSRTDYTLRPDDNSFYGNGYGPAAHAQQEASRQFGSEAGAIVNEALALTNQDRHAEALSGYAKALAVKNLTAYELSQIHQMMAMSHYEQKQYDPAIAALQNAIQAGGLLPNEAEDLRVQIAQLLIADGQYAKGAEAMEAYLNGGGERKPAYIDLLVQAWVQSNNYAKALPWAEIWFEQASPKERKHFDLMNFLYNQLGMQARQADIVKQMIARWPEDETLWHSWASMLAAGGREGDAFEVTKMLYLGGALTSEQDLKKIVQYYSFYDMPYQAARILEREMSGGRIARTNETLEQLSTLYRQAREYKKAIPVLEEAASRSSGAKLHAALGEAYYNEGQCDKSETVFCTAMSRGYDAGKSWMLIGTCRYEQVQKMEPLKCDMEKGEMARAEITLARKSAIEAFQNISVTSRQARNAQKWIKFIGAERDSFHHGCAEKDRIIKERCFYQIKQAYDAVIFTRDFKLDDPETCAQYKDEYDSKFRVTIGGE